MSKYIKIKGDHIDKEIADAQNKTGKYVWPKLSKNKVFYIADTVGSGKSFIALSLALGKWRQVREIKRQKIFRILVISPTSELCHSWLSKLCGEYQSSKDHIGNLAIIPQKKSFFDFYMNQEFNSDKHEIAVYHFRGSQDVSRMMDDLEAKPKELKPKSTSTKPRLEILVTTPNWLGKGRHGNKSHKSHERLFWLNWLGSVDVIIADEVFSAKNPGTQYGKLLRQNQESFKGTRFWPNRNRPWLIGLSATMLSRDITDAEELLKIAWGWQDHKYQYDSSYYNGLQQKLKDFQESLKQGLNAEPKEIKRHSEIYKKSKSSLEKLLKQIIVRTQPVPKRTYEFASAGTSIIQRSTPSNNFPISKGIRSVFTELSQGVEADEQSITNLSNFMKAALARSKVFDQKQDVAVDAWTAVLELAGKAHGPKHESLKKWLEDYYSKAEADWIRSSRTEHFKFKVLVYVKHVNTAKAFRHLKSDKKNIEQKIGKAYGDELYRWLRGRMLRTCKEIAKKHPDLFENGNLDKPKIEFVERLQEAGFKENEQPILILKKPAHLTLLMSALVHANKVKSKADKITNFIATVQGHLHLSEKHAYLWLLSRYVEQRREILKDIFAEELLNIDLNKLNRKCRLPSLSMFILNIENIYLPENEKHIFLEKINGMAKEIFKLSGVNTKILQRYQLKKLWAEFNAYISKTINDSPTWRRKRDEVLHQKMNFALKLKRKNKDLRHNAPSELEHLTGSGSNLSRRNFVTERFLTPGNPFVLVLTNICTVGVDLHKYCWDVVHFTPSWTPHELEQKIGRIDRPRVGLEETFNIAKKKEEIRVHHLIWPHTYDERMLSRVHLRAQFSERLLGKKIQNTFDGEKKVDEDKFEHFKPLNLSP